MSVTKRKTTPTAMSQRKNANASSAIQTARVMLPMMVKVLGNSMVELIVPHFTQCYLQEDILVFIIIEDYS
jgi:hypothetical protein